SFLVTHDNARHHFWRLRVEAVGERLHMLEMFRHQFYKFVMVKVSGSGNDQIARSETVGVGIEQEWLFELSHCSPGPQYRLTSRLTLPEVLDEDLVDGALRDC